MINWVFNGELIGCMSKLETNHISWLQSDLGDVEIPHCPHLDTLILNGTNLSLDCIRKSVIVTLFIRDYGNCLSKYTYGIEKKLRRNNTG